jgi:hypothetical protein
MAGEAANAEANMDQARRTRDSYVLALYRTGDYTLESLARAACLSKQRISQIVKDGEQ